MVTVNMVVGLGKTGLRTLNSLALQLPQNNDRRIYTPLIGFNWLSNDPVADDVDFYPIDGDVKTWLSDRDYLLTRADIVEWFDVHTFANSTYTVTELDYSERQLGRLQFWYFLEQNFHKVHDNLQRQVQALQNSQNDRAIHLHLLANLEDTVTRACLLDIVSLLYSTIATEDQICRIILHLALPAAASTDKTDTNLLTSSYATIRELQRFAVSYGISRNRLYHPDYPLQQWVPTTGEAFSAVRVYHQVHQTSIDQRWVDILLPLLDSESDRMGAIYTQNLANWANTRQNALEKRSVRNEMVVGTYEAYSAIFPLNQLRFYWAQKIATDAMQTKLNTKVTIQQATDIFRQLWQPGNLQSDLRPPFIFSAIVDHKLGKTPEDLYDQFVPKNDALAVDFRRANNIFGDVSSTLDTSLSASDYVADTYDILLNKFGDLNDQQSHGNVHTAFSAYQKAYEERFVFSMEQLLQQLMDDKKYGIKIAHVLINTVLLPQSKSAHLQVKQLLFQLQREIRGEDYEQIIRNRGRRISKVTTWFGKLTNDVQSYNRLINRIAKNFEAYILLQQVEQFLTTCIEYLNHLATQLTNWKQILWEGDDNLIARLQAHKPTLNLDFSTTRMWLFDEDWIDTKYAKIKADELNVLQQHIKWQYSDSRIKLMLKDWNGIETIIKPNEDIVSYLYQEWVTLCHQRVQSEYYYDIWHDYLAMENRFDRKIDQLTNILVNDETRWVLDLQAERNFLVLPVNIETEEDRIDEIKDKLIKAKTGKFDVKRSTTNNRIIRWSAREGFLLSELPEYRRMKQIYETLSYKQKIKRQVLNPEREALYLEERASQLLKRDITIEGDLLMLVTNLERLQQFLHLQAFDFIRKIELEKNAATNRYTTGYCLTEIASGDNRIIQNVWWLPKHDNQTLYNAILAFVEEADVQVSHRSFDDKLTPLEHLEPIPYEVATNWVDSAVDEFIRLHDDEFTAQDISLERTVQNLLHFQGKTDGNWALRVGFITDKLDILLTTYKQSQSGLDASDSTYQLYDLIITVLTEMIFDNKRQLQHRLI